VQGGNEPKGVLLGSLESCMDLSHLNIHPSQFVQHPHPPIVATFLCFFSFLSAVGVLAYDGWLHLNEGVDAWGTAFFMWLTSPKEHVLASRPNLFMDHA